MWSSRADRSGPWAFKKINDQRGGANMADALSLWGFIVSGETVMICIAVYLFISVLAIVLIPKWSVPKSAAGDPTPDISRLIDMRAKVRATVLQVIGGVTVVAGFITTLQSIRGTEDAFNQKKADLFAQHVKELLADGSKADSQAEAIYVLSYVARSDRSYHRAVYDALASFVIDRSASACKGETYRHPGYQRDRSIQLAMRTIGERKAEDDQTGKRLNLEGGCFVGVDLLDEWGVVKGLAKARLSGSTMLRADFGRVELPNAQLMGIVAGDYLNPGWSPEIGRTLHTGDEGDPRKADFDGDKRRKYVAHFIDALLEGADFGGAQLQGADFSGARLKGAKFDGAVISRTSFKGAQDLTADQLKVACVGRADMTDKDVDLEQPYLSPALRADVKKHPDLKGRIAKCSSKPGG
jgi:uncharacterized protein YjbI with pentapeptide repeats